jgi:FkbM family methyltransferase
MNARKRLAVLVNWLVRRVSSSRRAALLAALLRNQCDLVIGYHLAPSASASKNGEEWLVERIAPRVNRFIDIGANVGMWSAMMSEANPGAEGVAVEPGAEALQALRSRLAGRVEIVDAAVADSPGMMSLFEQPSASEHSSLVWRPEGTTGIERGVAVTTVDELMSRLQWPQVDLLKIDTEGFDGRVLEGATNALAERRLGIIQFEYNIQWALAGSTLGSVLDRLRANGYEVFALRAHSLAEFDYPVLGEFFRYSNFVAVAPEYFGWVGDLVEAGDALPRRNRTDHAF